MSFSPTLLEKTFALSHLPSAISTILVAAFVGPLGNFLYLYSVSNSLMSALYGTLLPMNTGESGFVSAVWSSWYILAGNILWYIFLFYTAFLISYLRGRLAKAGPELVSLAPEGEQDVYSVFKVVSKYVPQLVLVFVFLFVYATSIPDLLAKGELTTFSTLIYILRSLVRSVMFGSVLWVYCASLWGLYRFGKKNLRFKSYQEDLLLGTKKLGSLSFTFSVTYFLGLALFAGQMALGGLAGQTSVVNVVFLLVLVPVGIALFLAPLVSTHGRMLEAKRAEVTSTNRLLSELISRVRETGEKDEANLIGLLTLQNTERKVTLIRTWPIENPLIGKLAVITASVAATLIARLIQILLHI